MTYKLKFHPKALEEFQALTKADKAYFKEKIGARLETPHIPSALLIGGHNLYKIKRKRPPLRLTYHADDNHLIVTALSVGKRDSDVYTDMINRYKN